MDKQLQLFGVLATILITVIGTTITIDNRYAKSQEVRHQLENYYEKQLELRILEINLKRQKTPEDRALLEYLKQQIDNGKGK